MRWQYAYWISIKVWEYRSVQCTCLYVYGVRWEMSLTCASVTLNFIGNAHFCDWSTCQHVRMIKRLPQHLKLISPPLILFVTYLLVPLISNISTSIVCLVACDRVSVIVCVRTRVLVCLFSIYATISKTLKWGCFTVRCIDVIFLSSFM